MSRKLDFIPNIPSYEFLIQEMKDDFEYRMNTRLNKTSFGRPLYERINCQIVMTQECPYKCPFCIERKHPMKGQNNFEAQLESLKKILKEHPSARITLTGGEPGLYLDHVNNVYKLYKELSDQTFISINTTLYNPDILNIGNNDITFNISANDYVHPNLDLFNDNCCYQTILDDEHMTKENIKSIMNNKDNIKNYSFRFLTELGKNIYSVNIWKEIKEDPELEVKTFRIGDFFVYLTFNYKGKRARITLGDMNIQMNTDYKDGYSNIIIHPDGRIGTNWK